MAGNRGEPPTLVAQTGPLRGQRWDLKDSLTVGREPSCEIVIPDRQVSRYHARFRLTPEGIILEDLSSKNGTHCNGQPITEPVLLQDGDVIQVALTQQFLYLLSESTATVPLETALASEKGAEVASMIGRLRLEKRSRRVWVDSQEILPPLSVSQFRLLELLYDRQGRVVERQDLVGIVWGDEEAMGVSEQALDALIRRLRDRLAAADPKHAYIVTVRGHGLRLDNPLV
jgi:pSer/pThr/pTyr-binding forkhead associated (FHA) protein